MTTAILSVIYYEPEWLETCKCLSAVNHPTFFVDRNGTGSLAGAINNGFKRHCLGLFDYVWIITNVIFRPDTLDKLLTEMHNNPSYCAITPVFESDHPHTRPVSGNLDTVSVPFMEFTAPLVRGPVFAANMLDESMPYSGHDLDWGYRMRQKGYKLGAARSAKVDHVYIRHSASKHPATVARLRLRNVQEDLTKQTLARKYGPDWFNKLRFNY